MILLRLLSLSILILILLVAFAVPLAANQDKMKDPYAIGNRDVARGVNFYSLEREIQLGRQLAQEVERTVKLVEDPVITEFVNRIGQNLARNSDVKVPVTVKVIDDPQVNAFALPGGFMFINSGLIEKAQTEAELAGVIAHEIAHVAARHGTRQAWRGQVANLASLPLIFMGGWAGYGVQQAAGLAIPLTFLKFSRDFERQADMLAVQYLYRAGYDTSAFIDFFERLEAEEKRRPGTLSEIFRTHPPTGDRIRDVQKHISELRARKSEFVLTTSEFDQVKNRLERLNARRTVDPQDPNRPTLRRTERPRDPVEPADRDAQAGHSGDDRDERPVLRRAS